MKKRAKLFTTIASLCMAVALMAFGVYAASSSALSVTSQVSFKATGVNIDWEVTVAGAQEKTEGSVNKTYQITDMTAEEIASPDEQTRTQALGELKMTAGTQLVITVKCINNGGNNVTVTPSVDTYTNANITFSGALSPKTINASTNDTFVYTFDVIDASVDVAPAAFNPVFTAVIAE